MYVSDGTRAGLVEALVELLTCPASLRALGPVGKSLFYARPSLTVGGNKSQGRGGDLFKAT